MTFPWEQSMRIISVTKKDADNFVVNKHYSRRASIFWAAFGLVENAQLTGVVVYGQPSPPVQRSAFENRNFRLYELCRLVVQSKTKNAASFLVGNSLKKLERPSAVVSYADSEWHHCGIVYQATNWLYTGATVSHDHVYIIDGRRVHPITVRDKFGIKDPKRWAKENNIQTLKPMPKHRYFFFNGNRLQRKDMRAKLRYAINNNYPKCDAQRYDDGPQLNVGVAT